MLSGILRPWYVAESDARLLERSEMEEKIGNSFRAALVGS